MKRAPDSSGGPLPDSFLLQVLPRGTRLIRLFNQAEYDAQGWPYTSLKPTALPAYTDPTEGGRFDGVEDSPVPVSYVAAPADPTVPVWEVFSSFITPGTWADGRALSEADLADYSFIFLRTTRELRFADIRTAAGASYYNADIVTLQSRDRNATRAWGRYFRRYSAGIDGLVYTSTAYGDNTHGYPYVLFGPPCTLDDLEQDGDTSPVTEKDGRVLLEMGLDSGNVSVTP